jgi:hypothetical protein
MAARLLRTKMRTIVGVTDEPVTALEQFPVQIVE